jgi:transcriptional regulator with XRE-family HTH domain
MKTLYLRNVPEDVSDRLERLAAREGLSVSALALRELAAASRRIDNAELLADLPDLGVPADEIVASLDEGRERS